MKKFAITGMALALTAGMLAGCGSPAYTPVAAQSAPIDASAYAPSVDSFVVLLDTSGSMKDEDAGRLKIHTAQDLVASFNQAVPPYDFQAGLVTFGKGTHSCIGAGIATDIYAYGDYDKDAFANALGSIRCAASTTPIADAIDITTEALDVEGGPVAVYIVSDFRWTDTETVAEAIEQLRFKHGHNLCLHTIKIGEFSDNDDLINEMTNDAGCGTATNAASIAASGMSDYVTRTLMAPLAYEAHSVSATALFGLDNSSLTAQGKAELANLAEYIQSKGMSVGDIDVIGHTCSLGDQGYNQRLSTRRAMSVKNYLVERGLDGSMIDIKGMGEIQPIANNATEAGREQNRRVEIHVGTSRPSP